MSSFLASHTWRRLNPFYDISVTFGMNPPVALGNQLSCGGGWTQIGPMKLTKLRLLIVVFCVQSQTNIGLQFGVSHRPARPAHPNTLAS